jgi:hypothetical protein
MAMSPLEEAFFVEASCSEGTREGSYFAGLVEGGENRGRTSSVAPLSRRIQPHEARALLNHHDGMIRCRVPESTAKESFFIAMLSRTAMAAAS